MRSTSPIIYAPINASMIVSTLTTTSEFIKKIVLVTRNNVFKYLEKRICNDRSKPVK